MGDVEAFGLVEIGECSGNSADSVPGTSTESEFFNGPSQHLLGRRRHRRPFIKLTRSKPSIEHIPLPKLLHPPGSSHLFGHLTATFAMTLAVKISHRDGWHFDMKIYAIK